MPDVQVEQLYQTLNESPHFEQIYRYVCRLIRHKQSPHFAIKEQIHQLIEPYYTAYPPEKLKRIYNKLYILLLKRVRAETLQLSVEQEAKVGLHNAPWPQMPPSPTIQEPTQYPSYQSSYGSQASFDNGSLPQEGFPIQVGLPVPMPGGLGNGDASMPFLDASQTIMPSPDEQERYQSMVFPQGTYLVDLLNGSTWFRPNGQQQFMRCHFPPDQGTPPQGYATANLFPDSPPTPKDPIKISGLQKPPGQLQFPQPSGGKSPVPSEIPIEIENDLFSEPFLVDRESNLFSELENPIKKDGQDQGPRFPSATLTFSFPHPGTKESLSGKGGMSLEDPSDLFPMNLDHHEIIQRYVQRQQGIAANAELAKGTPAPGSYQPNRTPVPRKKEPSLPFISGTKIEAPTPADIRAPLFPLAPVSSTAPTPTPSSRQNIPRSNTNTPPPRDKQPSHSFENPIDDVSNGQDLSSPGDFSVPLLAEGEQLSNPPGNLANKGAAFTSDELDDLLGVGSSSEDGSLLDLLYGINDTGTIPPTREGTEPQGVDLQKIVTTPPKSAKIHNIGDGLPNSPKMFQSSTLAFSAPKSEAADTKKSTSTRNSSRSIFTVERELTEKVLQTYPYPLASAFEAFVEAERERERLRLLFHLHGICLRYITAPFIIQYLRKDQYRDLQMTLSLLRIQSGKLDEWFAFLKEAVQFFSASPPTFLDSFINVYMELEEQRPESERFEYSEQFQDSLGKKQVSTILLGMLEAVVIYRNSFGHGFNPNTEQAREALNTYEPVLFEILKAMEPLVRFPLLYVFNCEVDGSYQAYPLYGGEPPFSSPLLIPPLDDHPDVERPLFLGHPDYPDEYLPLYPLLIAERPLAGDLPLPSQSNALFLLLSSIASEFSYQSMRSSKFSTQDGLDYWRKLLEKKLYPITKARAPSELLEQTRTWTEFALIELQGYESHSSDLCIPREKCQSYFSDFYSSASTLLLLTGMAGVGKTTLLIQEAEKYLQEGKPVLFLRATDFGHGEFKAPFARILGIEEDEQEDKWESITLQLAANLSTKEPLLLIVDDIELHEDIEAFLTEMDECFSSMLDSVLAGRIKVILSMQSLRYRLLSGKKELFPKSASHFFSKTDSLGFQSKSFAFEIPLFDDKELEKAYDFHRRYEQGHGLAPFHPETSWEALQTLRSTFSLLHHPLCLRLAATTFCKKELPEELTIEDLLQSFFSVIVEEKHSPLPVPERLQFLRALLGILQDGKQYLTREELYQKSTASVLRTLQNEHTDSSYIQLLHLGILEESWMPGEGIIRFASTLIFAYFLAQDWAARYDLEPMKEACVSGVKSFPPEVVPFYWSALMRSSNRHNAALKEQLLTWLQDPEQRDDVMLNSFLFGLVCMDDPDWQTFLEMLLQTGQSQLLENFLEVADRLFRTNSFVQMKAFLAFFMQDVVRLQNDFNDNQSSTFTSEVLYRLACLDEREGHYQAAIDKINQCIELAEKVEAKELQQLANGRLSSLQLLLEGDIQGKGIDAPPEDLLSSEEPLYPSAANQGPFPIGSFSSEEEK